MPAYNMDNTFLRLLANCISQFNRTRYCVDEISISSFLRNTTVTLPVPREHDASYATNTFLEQPFSWMSRGQPSCRFLVNYRCWTDARLNTLNLNLWEIKRYFTLLNVRIIFFRMNIFFPSFFHIIRKIIIWTLKKLGRTV